MERERHSHHSHRRHESGRRHGHEHKRGHKSHGRHGSGEPVISFREKTKAQGCLIAILVLLVCAGVLLAALMLFDPGFKETVDHWTKAEDMPVH
jgi:hypothetical protein